MNYHHLTIEERCCIRIFYLEGLSYRRITQLICRSPSMVSREIARNRTHKLSFLDITIPHPLHLEKIQKGCGLCFLKSQLFSKLKNSIE